MWNSALASPRVGIAELTQKYSKNYSVNTLKKLEEQLEIYFKSTPEFYPQLCSLNALPSTERIGNISATEILKKNENGAKFFIVDKAEIIPPKHIDTDSNSEGTSVGRISTLIKQLKAVQATLIAQDRKLAFAVIYPGRFWLVPFNHVEAKEQIIKILGNRVQVILTTNHHPGSPEFHKLLFSIYMKHPLMLGEGDKNFNQLPLSTQHKLINEVEEKLSHSNFVMIDFYESNEIIEQQKKFTLAQFLLLCHPEKKIKSVVAPTAAIEKKESKQIIHLERIQSLAPPPLQAESIPSTLQSTTIQPLPKNTFISHSNTLIHSTAKPIKPNKPVTVKKKTPKQKPRSQSSRNRGSTKCYQF